MFLNNNIIYYLRKQWLAEARRKYGTWLNDMLWACREMRIYYIEDDFVSCDCLKNYHLVELYTSTQLLHKTKVRRGLKRSTPKSPTDGFSSDHPMLHPAYIPNPYIPSMSTYVPLPG